MPKTYLHYTARFTYDRKHIILSHVSINLINQLLFFFVQRYITAKGVSKRFVQSEDPQSKQNLTVTRKISPIEKKARADPHLSWRWPRLETPLLESMI